MTIEEQKKYISDQRAKGTPDDVILRDIQKTSQPVGQPPQQRGVAGELLPTLFSVGGGIAGGILGGPVGAIAGAGGGGALGETVQQGIEKKYGQRETMNPGQIAGTGVIGSALEATGGIFVKLAKPVIKFTKPAFVGLVSKLSGYGEDVVDAAMKRTPGAIAGVKEGEQALLDMVKKTSAAINTLATNTVKETKESVARFHKNSVTGALPGTKDNLIKESKKYTSDIIVKLRDFNIGVTKTGELLFDRAKQMSNIVSPGDRKAIQSAFDSVRGLSKNPDIKNIDSVMERLITLRSKTPVGTPTGAETRKIIANISDSVLNFVKSVPEGYGKGYKGYVDFLQTNLPKRIMISDAKEIFGGKIDLSPKEMSIITNRMLSIYDTGKLAIKDLATEVGEKTGLDITGTTAGTLIKTGKPVDVSTRNITARGIFEKVLEAIPRGIVKSYVATGKVTSELNTILNGFSKSTGIAKDVLLTEIANLMSNKTTK